MSKVYGNASVFDDPMPNITVPVDQTISTPTSSFQIKKYLPIIIGVPILLIVILSIIVFREEIMEIINPKQIQIAPKEPKKGKSNLNDIVKEIENSRMEHSETENDMYMKKSGWCNTGSDRGYRSCVYVNEDDECTSKKIYPSRDVCINPNLRV